MRQRLVCSRVGALAWDDGSRYRKECWLDVWLRDTGDVFLSISCSSCVVFLTQSSRICTTRCILVLERCTERELVQGQDVVWDCVQGLFFWGSEFSPMSFVAVAVLATIFVFIVVIVGTRKSSIVGWRRYGMEVVGSREGRTGRIHSANVGRRCLSAWSASGVASSQTYSSPCWLSAASAWQPTFKTLLTASLP